MGKESARQADGAEVSYAIDSATYAFERTTPTGREKIVCRRRISFDQSPFGLAPATQYSADCSTESLPRS